MILVGERYKENLKRHISDNPRSVPGRSGEPAVVKVTCQWVKEITDALAFTHGMGMILRDLNLESILV